MVNLKNYTHLWLFLILCNLLEILSLPFEHDSLHHLRNETLIKSQLKQNLEDDHKHNDAAKDAKIFKNSSDLVAASSDYNQPQLNLQLAAKPRGFNLPKSRPALKKHNETPQSAAQSYYSNYFPNLSPLEHAQPFYSLTEDPIIAKFLSHQTKQFQPIHQPLTAHDASILGSGDFGILKGGTFYSDEERAYINEEGSDFYYGDASNTHPVSSTEGFIQKYTYPEEQFAQFRDFADLGTPADSAFSQYVVVYAAKNSTSQGHNSKPKNIFEQLQEIDKEKALEQKRLRKMDINPRSITKLKLVRTKLMEKKWAQKQPVKIVDDDPLIALS